MTNNSENLQILITTHDDLHQAEILSKHLIDRNAAACVNILPKIISIYKWEGAMQVEDEIMLIIKTTIQKVRDAEAIIKEHHTYDVPEIIRIEAEVLHQPYMDWIRRSLGI